jgi:hypothetical protein
LVMCKVDYFPCFLFSKVNKQELASSGPRLPF